MLFPLSLCVCVILQRHGRVQETQLKCTKARNDYLLNLAAANAAMNKYYLQDVSTLIDVRNMQFILCDCLSLDYLTSWWDLETPFCATAVVFLRKCEVSSASSWRKK